jgi:hypothetical protein
MKNRILAASVLILLALTASAWTGDVAGKWTAKGAGGADITFVFKVAEGKLTGTVTNSLSPGDAEIQDGKINGDDVSFSLKRNINGTDTTVLWKGKIAGDEIKFTRSTQGGAAGGAPTEMVAKRAK